MQSTIQANAPSKAKLRTGYVLTALTVLFLVFDGVSHILKPAPVVKAWAELGYPLSVSVWLGVLLLGCVALYAFPRTAVLGAILLTGYLGGAVATHVRVGNPLFECIFPVLFGLVMWAGIFLRDSRLGELIPLRK
jgi:hypothetical protein